MNVIDSIIDQNQCYLILFLFFLPKSILLSLFLTKINVTPKIIF